VNSLATDIINKLVEEKVGYIPGTDDTESTGWLIFNQHQPNVLKAVVVRQYEGPAPMVFQNKEDAARALEDLRFQVMVKAQTDSEASRKCESIAALFENYTTFVVPDEEGELDEEDNPLFQVRYHHIVRHTSPFPLASEEKGVYVWVVNFRTVRQYQPAPEEEPET